MIQHHIDTRTRVFRAAVEPMIVAGVGVASARGLCLRELKHGRLIHVCAWCVPRDVKQGLDDLENVSHGICDDCSKKALEEPR